MAKYGRQYRVIEDNGGGLHLYVWTKGGKMIYSHSGYEYNVGQLTEDLGALDEGDNPRKWENNALDGGGDNDYGCLISSRPNGGAKIICDDGTWYPDDMGAAGQSEYAAWQKSHN